MSYMHNCKYLEIRFWIFNSLYLKNAWSSLCAFLHNSIVIQDHSVDRLFNVYSLFHKVLSWCHKQSCRIGGWGWWGANKWMTPPIQKILYGQVALIQTIFSSTSHNVAASMPDLTSQSCDDSLPVVCLAEQGGAIYRPPKHLLTPDRPVNEAPVKIDHWTFGNGICMNC